MVLIQNWEDVSHSLSYLADNEITLNVQNDNPAHLMMRLRTQMDFVIQLITSAKEELPDKLKKENSRGKFPVKYITINGVPRFLKLSGKFRVSFTMSAGSGSYRLHVTQLRNQVKLAISNVQSVKRFPSNFKTNSIHYKSYL